MNHPDWKMCPVHGIKMTEIEDSSFSGIDGWWEMRDYFYCSKCDAIYRVFPGIMHTASHMTGPVIFFGLLGIFGVLAPFSFDLVELFNKTLFLALVIACTHYLTGISIKTLSGYFPDKKEVNKK